MKLASEIKNIIIKNYVRQNNFEAEIEAVSKVLAERIEVDMVKVEQITKNYLVKNKDIMCSKSEKPYHWSDAIARLLSKANILKLKAE